MSTNGSFTRAQCQVNHTTATAPTPTVVIATQVGTSGCEISASPSIISAEPTVNATAPATSNGSFTPRYRGTWRIVPTKPASATGTSGTNTHRHPQTSATTPPIVGPTACPIPFTDAHAPTARPRRSAREHPGDQPHHRRSECRRCHPTECSPRDQQRQRRRGRRADAHIPRCRARPRIRAPPTEAITEPSRQRHGRRKGQQETRRPRTRRCPEGHRSRRGSPPAER